MKTDPKLKSEAMARRLGDSIGRFVGVDSKIENQLDPFFRLRVTIDLMKSLLRGTMLNCIGREVCVLFKYDRLHNFCFACGKIWHQIKDCDDTDVSGEDSDGTEFASGPWLRVSPFLDDYNTSVKLQRPGSQVSSGSSSAVVVTK